MEFAIIGALISAVGFGLANIVIKKALSSTSIPQTLLSSMISGAFFLFILVLLNGFPKDLSLNYILILALFAIGETCLYLSLYKAFEAVNVSVAAGVVSIYPIFSTIFSIIFLGESVSILKILFIILMVIGAIMISIEWSTLKESKLGLKSLTKGLPWAILCLFFHSIYFPLLGNLTSSGDWQFKLFGIKIFAIIFLVIIFVIIRKSKFEFTRNRIFAGVLLGLLEVLGWIGLSFGSSSTTGLIAIIVALGTSGILVTAVVAKFYLKEKLHALQYVGIFIVVIGSTLLATI